MAYKLYTLSPVTVAVAGTEVQLSSDGGLAAASVIITAKTGNDGAMYVGGEGVTSSSGEELNPGDSLQIGTDSLRGSSYEIFLNSIWVDAAVSGDSVTVQYLKLK